jgi:hypothetical protein
MDARRGLADDRPSAAPEAGASMVLAGLEALGHGTRGQSTLVDGVATRAPQQSGLHEVQSTWLF